METLGNRTLQSFIDGRTGIRRVTNYQIRASRGLRVVSFPDLVQRVAELSFYNPEHVLFFRGQKKDFTNVRNNTSIKPSIFRPDGPRRTSPPPMVVIARYEKLREAARRIVDLFRSENLLGKERVTRSRTLQWAILQHYEVCATPLLDVTHSLRVAASFATLDQTATDPVLYVLAAPSLGGTINSSSEQGIQTIRLSSICPPHACRPYFQEGYLLGEFPELGTFDEKRNYQPFEIDFGLRLLAKFHIAPENFWSANYSPIPKGALFPDDRDPLFQKTERIRNSLPPH